LQPWVTIPTPSFLEKQSRLKVTLYGPYGLHTQRLKKITRSLRDKYKFSNTYLVLERHDFRKPLKNELDPLYLRNKSYHYLEFSDVNIFVYYCNAYNDSVDFEFKHVCDKLRWKIPCCTVIRDKSCEMAMLLKGEIIHSKVRVDYFDGDKPICDYEITKIAVAKCLNFLKTKFYMIR
jgi:hypothetical protein